MNKTRENKYGHLLDKYLDGGKNKSHNPVLEREKEKYIEETKSKYGDLLKNAKPNLKLYEDMMKVEEVGRKIQQQRAEEEYLVGLRRQECNERIQREEQERIKQNEDFVNRIIDKKKAEQEAIEQRKKEEREKQEFYDRVQRMMNISTDLAEAFINVQSKY